MDHHESAARLAGQTSDTVFTYNAHALHTWMCPSLVARGVLCSVLSNETIWQGFLMVASALLLSIFAALFRTQDNLCKQFQVPETIDGLPNNNHTRRTGGRPMHECAEFFRNTFLSQSLTLMEQQVGSLTRFVLGGFVVFALARTYFANRNLLGNVFGSTLGLSMMVTACLKPPIEPTKATSSASEEVRGIQQLLIRWVNAAFLLMYLENAQLIDANGRGAELLDASLTEDEWAHLAPLPSRCTYVRLARAMPSGTSTLKLLSLPLFQAALPPSPPQAHLRVDWVTHHGLRAVGVCVARGRRPHVSRCRGTSREQRVGPPIASLPVRTDHHIHGESLPDHCHAGIWLRLEFLRHYLHGRRIV